MEPREKDPERVRLGRMGALTVHARGRTNTGPAREAWESNVAAEFGIGEDIDAVERERRMDAAMRVRMTRLANARWASRKKAGAEGQSPAPATGIRRVGDEHPD